MTTCSQICPILIKCGVRQVSTSGFVYAKEFDEYERQGAMLGEIINWQAINACINCPVPGECYEDIFGNAGKVAWEIKNARYLDQALTGTDL